MKTLFKGKGKLVLACLIALCAVLLSCAVLLCCTLLNNNVNNTANEDNTSTTIEAPELNIESTRADHYIQSIGWDFNGSTLLQLPYGTKHDSIWFYPYGNGEDPFGYIDVLYPSALNKYITDYGDGFGLASDAPEGFYTVEIYPILDCAWYNGSANSILLDIQIVQMVQRLAWDDKGTKTLTLAYGETHATSWFYSYGSGTDPFGHVTINYPDNLVSYIQDWGDGFTANANTPEGTYNIFIIPDDYWGDGKYDTITLTLIVKKKEIQKVRWENGTNSVTVEYGTANTQFLFPYGTGVDPFDHITIYVSSSYNPYITAFTDGVNIAANTPEGTYSIGIWSDSVTVFSGVEEIWLEIVVRKTRTVISNITASQTSFDYSTSAQSFTLSSVSYVSVTPPTGWSKNSTTITIPAKTTVGSNYKVSITPDESHCWSDYSRNTKTITITIKKATPTATASISGGTHYIGDTLSTVGISGSGSVSGTFAWSSPTTKLTASGTYTWKFTPTDTTNYNSVTDTIQVIAVAKLEGITVSGAKQSYKAFESFSTAGMVVTAIGGSSKVVTSYTYTTPYSGTDRSYFLVSDSGSSVTISYTENDITVTASITITVTKADFNMSGASWNYTSAFTYDGGIKTVSITGLPGGLTPTYSNNSKTNAGDYTASVTFTYDSANYNAPSFANLDWSIVKANYNMNSVQWNYSSPFTYDGNAKTVTLSGLPAGVTPNYTNNSKTNAGDYIASVTFSYNTLNYNAPTSVADLAWKINKADYNVSGLVFANKTVTYNGQMQTLTVAGSAAGVHIDGYTCNGVDFTGATEAGTYNLVAVVSVDDAANHNIPKFTATLKIDKATPVVTVNVSAGIYYIGDYLGDVALSIVNSTVSGTVGWTYNTSQLSGERVEYDWTFVPATEYAKNYNNATGKYLINAVYKLASISVTSTKTNYTAFERLDESTITVTATYVTGKNPTAVTGWTFVYPGSTAYFTVSDDGKKVVFTYTESNIPKTCELTISVGKKTVDMTGVSMTSVNETYTGNPYSIKVEGTLPEVLELTGYLYNNESATSATDAGTYLVKAQFTLKDTVNYVMPELGATLTIDRATPVINVSGVNTSYKYNGTLQTVNSGATVNNTEQTIAYRDNTFTTVAEGNNRVVTIFVTESKNYKAGSETVTLTVEKAEVSLEWTGGNGVYDGTEHNATLTVSDGVFARDLSTFTTDTLKSHITVTYTTTGGDEARKHVGVYAPSYTGYPEGEPFCNYTPVLTNENYTFEITKDSVTGLTFVSDSFGYDGKNHVITITGTLPEQVTVTYYYKDTETEFTGVTDVKHENGEVVGYEIVAVFACESGNYEVPETLPAIITVTPRTITASDVSGIEQSYVYKGEAWEPEPVVTLTLTGATSITTLEKVTDYSVDYSTGDYDAGTSVEVTVNGTGNYTGTVIKTFTIEKSVITMEFGTVTSFTYNGKGQGVSVVFSGIAESDKDTVVPEVKYVGRGGTEYAESTSLPVNAGYYTVTVSLDLTSDNYESTIVNGNFKHFEIKKAEVTVTVGFVTYRQGDTVYAGSALPDIEISSPVMFEGKLVKGEVSWQKTGNAPATLKQGTNDYVWVFTPDDQTNFAQANGKLTVWNAILADISGITVEWNTENRVQPDLYTSTTLETVRTYLIVTGQLETTGSVEIADYNIIGSWGSEESPAKGGTYFFTITTSDEKFTELVNSVLYDDVMLIGISVKPVFGVEIKKSYTAYDTFDRNNVIVTAEYNDKAKVEVTDYTVTYPENRDCFWAKENEYQSVAISYGDCEPVIISGITVLKKDFDVKGITFEPTRTETYNGTSKIYGVKGVYDIGTVSYSYSKWDGEAWLTVGSNAVVNAGTYKITAHFNINEENGYNLNYNIIEDMESVLTVKKANCNLDDLVFEDTDCDYAYGKSLSDKVNINVIPDGVTKVEYEYRDAAGKKINADDLVNAGAYKVSVKFTVDENHEPIALDGITLTINPVSPKINPTISGSLNEGVKLNDLTFVNSDGDTAGEFKWDNSEYLLKAGINRCYYTFTPDDTTNFKSFRGYVDLTAGGTAIPAESNNGGLGENLVWVLVAVIAVVLLVAMIALVVSVKASKKRAAAGDDDGFYDDISDDDLM